MRKQSSLLRTNRRKIIYFVVILIALAAVTPALADYLGPNRTVTETAGVCKIVLNECKYVAAKDDYLYRTVNDWSCSNESKPWRAYPSEPPRACSPAAVGEKYWERDESQHEVTTTYPPATISGTLQNCTLHNGWCTSAPQLFLNGTEPVAGYNILAIEGTRNGQTFACSGSSCSVPLAEGTNNFTYWALSSFADTSLMGSLSAKVDSQQPVITGALSGTSGWNGWYISPVTYTGSASDTTSGLVGLTCSLDGIALGSCSPINISSDGLHILTLTAQDNAGHTRTLTQNASVDTQNPILDASITGTLGSNTWYTAASLHATASDASPGSGLSSIEYNLDDGTWFSFPSSGVLTLPDGRHSLNVRAMDNAGRTVASSKSFWLDSSTPSITLNPVGTLGSNNWYITNLDLTASASDSVSGIDVFEYSRDNSNWTTYTSSLILTNGIHSISFWAQDEAGLVSQTSQTYKVDTRPPQIAGDLSGVQGENDWFISNVTLSASASDPAPGSGIDAFSYILNGSSESPYTTALNLSDGEHTIELNTRDNAGLVYSMEQTVKVDTTPPSLNITTTLPEWIKNSISLDGTAGDHGSGLSKVEISTDGGQTWQSVSGTTSWSFLWNTPNSTNGKHDVIVRASDSAGLINKQTIKTGVDNQGPKIRLPDSWFQWDTITLDIWDNESGLSEARIEISDPEGRWPARRIRLNPDQFPMQFKWDRRFGDDTVAPLGTYNLRVMAFDNLGNLAHESAEIKILLGILPAGPTATLQPSVRTESTPTSAYTVTPIPSTTATQAVVVKAFGSTLEPAIPVTPMPEAVPAPRATPSQTSVLDWLEAVFLPDSNSEESTTDVESGETGTSSRRADMNSGILWGAAAAAMIGSMTAYAVEERRKQQEERERQLAQEAREEERRDKIRAQKMEKLETQWAQERVWEQARLEQEQQEQLRQQEKDARNQARMDEILLQRGPEAEEAAKWYASVAAIRERDADKRRAEEEKKKADELQAGLAAYYDAMRQGEKDARPQEQNWWENTKSFMEENIIQPLSTSIYQPYLKPALENMKQFLNEENAQINEKIYQPYIQPAIESTKLFLINESTWINEKINRPYIIPAVERTKEFITDEVTWINEKLYQPYIQPALVTINDTVYEPYINPFLDMTKEVAVATVSSINRNIYQPYIQPIVNDFNQYVYQPVFKPVVDDLSNWGENTWDKYGEWVHGALDAAGFIPGVGEIADGINGLIYLGEGRYIEASVSAMAMIPIVGDLGKAGKWTVKIGQEFIEESVEKVVKEGVEEVAEKVIKEATKEVAEQTIEHVNKETVQRVLTESVEGKVTKLPADVAQGLTKDGANELAGKISAELGGKNVWVSEKTGSIYISKPPAEGFALAEKLAKTDLTKTKEVEKILRRVAELTSRGSGNHVVLGPFKPNGAFIQEALDTDGVFWDVGDELWEALDKTGIDMFKANDQFLRVQIERGIDRLDVIVENVDDVIAKFNSGPPEDWGKISYTRKEILDLSSMPDIPYQQVGNSWIRVD